MTLPRSASLGLWLAAHLRGQVSVDDLVAAVVGDDPRHLVSWHDETTAELVELPGLMRRAGLIGPDTELDVRLPVPGDLAGLAGPPPANQEALEAEEVLVISRPGLAPVGLIPGLDARVVWWQPHAFNRPQYRDFRETSRQLRQSLVETTRRLVALDVASWSAEIPDLLINQQAGLAEDVPADLAGTRRETLERALLCRTVVELALDDDGGAVSAAEIQARRAALLDLDRAARAALGAAASANLGAP